MTLHTHTCICGCGQTFQRNTRQALFLNREHATRFNAEQRKGQPQPKAWRKKCGRKKPPSGWRGGGAVSVTR